MAGKGSKKNIPEQVSPFVWGYLVTLQKQGVPIERAYLFGSWAKGTQHRDSDIDIAIVSPAFRDWDKKIHLLARARRLDFSDIEAHGFYSKNFNPDLDPVAAEIVRYGIRII